MPSTRSLGLAAGAAVLVGLQGAAVAQPARDPSGTGLLGQTVLSFVVGTLVYLLLGGGLVAVAPEYAEETVAAIDDDPASAFLWGLLVTVGGTVVLFILAVTVIGLVVAIPGAVALFLVGVVGNAVTVAWIGTWFGERHPGGREAAIGAVVMAAVGAVPVIGGFLTTLVGFFGLGVVSRRLYGSWQGDDDGRTDRGGSRREPPTPAESATGDRREDV